jgi:hypothetical protein
MIENMHYLLTMKEDTAYWCLFARRLTGPISAAAIEFDTITNTKPRHRSTIPISGNAIEFLETELLPPPIAQPNDNAFPAA